MHTDLRCNEFGVRRDHRLVTGRFVWGGPNPIKVTRLGVFDDLQDGIGGGDLVAELWSRSGNVGGVILSTATFTTADPGTLVGNNRMKHVTPLILAPGEYTIVAHGYGSGDRNGNADGGSITPPTIDDGGGLITFVGSSRFGAAGAFPGGTDGGPANRYYAGTFEFQGVPEPSTYVVFGGLILCFGFAGWWRKRKAAA